MSICLGIHVGNEQFSGLSVHLSRGSSRALAQQSKMPMLAGNLPLALDEVWFILWAWCCPKSRERQSHHGEWRLLWPVALADPSHISAGCLWKQLASSGRSAVLEGASKKDKKYIPISEQSTRICWSVPCWGSHSGANSCIFFLQWFSGWFLPHCAQSGIKPSEQTPLQLPTAGGTPGVKQIFRLFLWTLGA